LDAEKPLTPYLKRYMPSETLQTNMDIRIISWQQTIPLRHSVLWPSKPAEFCHIDGDTEGVHFGVFMNDVLVCVASVYVHHNKARLRKFATDERYQKQGIGSKLLGHMINYFKDSELEYFWCDARETALGFYKRFGMSKCSERFYKADIPYFKMEVTLSSVVKSIGQANQQD